MPRGVQTTLRLWICSGDGDFKLKKSIFFKFINFISGIRRITLCRLTVGATNPAQMVLAVEKLGADRFEKSFNQIKMKGLPPPSGWFS